jgi:hypothetical protein
MTFPSRSDGPWTTTDDDLLHQLAGSGKAIPEIAKQINRSVGSVRIRAFRLNVRIAKSGKLLGCPAWLGLSEDRMSFVFLADRAKIVQKIFEMSRAGLGGYTIAKQLNANKVAAFGPSPKWDNSTIHNMLTNRATFGERHFKRRRGSDVSDEVISNYYPAVIEKDLFYAVQEVRRKNLASGRGRKGRLITNLFGGMPTCAYCSNTVRFQNSGNDKSLICSTVLERRGCYRMGWSYQSFEESFFRFVTELEFNQLANQNDRQTISALKALVQRISGSDIYNVRQNIAIILKAGVCELRIASAGSAPVMGKPDARILRDGPGRYFEIRLRAGAAYTVFPAAVIEG